MQVMSNNIPICFSIGILASSAKLQWQLGVLGKDYSCFGPRCPALLTSPRCVVLVV
uniref:Uncharacterized protein n=1 Tax=Candidatus Entotheonella serta TaxID=1652106 RepID=A0A0K0PDC8_9BACT|nr:hypothetical protein [Candidatus Entotheonella serta]